MLFWNLCRSKILNHTCPSTKTILQLLRSIFLHAVFVSILTSSAAAQETAAERVASLRAHVSEVETAYSNTLVSSEQSPASSNRVDFLRKMVRDKANQLIQKATTQDAVLAVLRAETDTTLDTIRVYETHVGVGSGENTTQWNVFTEQQLKELRDKVNTRLDSLKRDIQNIPPKDVSPSAKFRIREVEGWRAGIEAEINRRQSLTEPVRLKEIPSGLTVEEARTKFPEITARDGGNDQHFRQKLAQQVQLRLHSAPQDAALRMLEREVPILKLTDILTSEPRGPPTSVQDARKQLGAAYYEELKAITRGDPVALAKARARTGITHEWLAKTLNKPINADKPGLSAVSTDQLIELRGKWKNWYAQLLLERQANPNTPSVESKIIDAERRISAYNEAIEYKALPRPPDGNDWGPENLPNDPPDPSNPPRPPKGNDEGNDGRGGRLPGEPLSQPDARMRAFEGSWDSQIARREIVELARARNEFSSMTNVEIPEAAIKAFQEKFNEEAASLHKAYDKTVKLERDLLIEGRGTPASEAGQQIRKARATIQAAASELLEFVSDTRLGGDPKIRQSQELLTKFARKNSSISNASYSDAILATEQAHDTLLKQSAKIEIQEVTKSGAKAGPYYHIEIEKKSGPKIELRNIKPPAEYKDLYPKQKTVPTFEQIIKDPRRAPGGVIIDGRLPDEISRRLKALQVDTQTGAIKAKVADAWMPVNLPQDLLLSRLAWAFVQDEQSAVIDLRPLEAEEAFWLVMHYGNNQSSNTDPRSLVEGLMRLTSVNVNEALRGTPIVPHLISADQLMFDLLPQEIFLLERENKWPALNLDKLRSAFRADAGAELNNPRSADLLFKKSLLAISSAKYEIGSELTLSPQISFHLFGVPHKGDDVFRLKACEQWFNDDEKTLRGLPQLSKLSDFAVLVMLFRSAREQSIQHNLDELIAVPVPAVTTPRFIVREDHIGKDGWRQLRESFAVKEN